MPVVLMEFIASSESRIVCIQIIIKLETSLPADLHAHWPVLTVQMRAPLLPYR